MKHQPPTPTIPEKREAAPDGLQVLHIKDFYDPSTGNRFVDCWSIGSGRAGLGIYGDGAPEEDTWDGRVSEIEIRGRVGPIYLDVEGQAGRMVKGGDIEQLSGRLVHRPRPPV
jgi:hypothetical protein